jgi:hypothetical protein
MKRLELMTLISMQATICMLIHCNVACKLRLVRMHKAIIQYMLHCKYLCSTAISDMKGEISNMQISSYMLNQFILQDTKIFLVICSNRDIYLASD